MNLDFDFITQNSVIIVPIIVALVQAIKLTGWVKDHFAPLVSIALGIALGFLVNHDMNDLSSAVLSGAIYGLTASGLYSGVKTTLVARIEQKQMQRKQQNH